MLMLKTLKDMYISALWEPNYLCLLGLLSSEK